MSRKHYLVDIAEARVYIEANYPNDPLLRQIVLNLLEKLPKVEDMWIPVTESLPAPYETVLVYDRMKKRAAEAYLTRHLEWVGVPMNHKITHWLPLPGVPEKEDEE